MNTTSTELTTSPSSDTTLLSTIVSTTTEVVISTMTAMSTESLSTSSTVTSKQDENQLKDVHFKLIEYIVMGSLFIFGGSMIATGLIFIFLRDKSSRLKFEKRVNARLKKLGVEPAVRKMIRETEKDALTRSQTESPNQSNTSLISLQ